MQSSVIHGRRAPIWLRIIAGIVGAVLAVPCAAVIGSIMAQRDGTSTAWATGLGVTLAAGLLAMPLGAWVGVVFVNRVVGSLAHRPVDAPVPTAWRWFAAIAIGLITTLIALLIVALMTQALALFIGQLAPGLLRLILFIELFACVGIGGLMGRLVLRHSVGTARRSEFDIRI